MLLAGIAGKAADIALAAKETILLLNHAIDSK